MTSAFFVLLSLALAASAQYNPQPYYPPYQPPQQPRGDYGRALVQAQPPYPNAYYQQPPPPPAYFGQQKPESIQVTPVLPYGFFQPRNELGELVFVQGITEHHRYLTPPTLKFKIGVVSGHAKKGSNKDEATGNFQSYLLQGYLQIQKNKENPETPNITLEIDQEKGLHKLESGINFENKGFELSTLNVFNGKLYACDDKTGVLYELKNVEEDDNKEEKTDDDKSAEVVVDSATTSQDKSEDDEEKKVQYVAQPWLILSNEGQNRGFRCEWGVVKDSKLWIGSTGSLVPKGKDEEVESKEVSNERQFVKVIDPSGEVTTLDWSKNYEKIAEAYDVQLKEGHVIHEAAAWSDFLAKWVFLPRRVTADKKDAETWNKLSTNEGVFADAQFNSVNKKQKLGNLTETSGVLGLRFIPGTQDQFILVLKGGEDEEGNHASTLSVLDLQGKEIMPETKVGDGTFFTAVEFL